MRAIEDDTPAMMALRGGLRSALLAGADVGAVMFQAVRIARRDGVSEEQLRLIVSDLRDEGLLPPVPAGE